MKGFDISCYTLEPELQKFSDLGLINPYSQLNLGFENIDLG